MNPKRFLFFRLYSGLTAIMALACLSLFPVTLDAAGKARVEKPEDLTHPSFRTLKVGSCPKDHARKVKGEWEKGEWDTGDRDCSFAQLMYPRYKNIPWMNRLIARSIILPMFAERLDEKPVREGSEARYQSKLIGLVRKGGIRGSVEKPPVIEFTARLAGYEKSSLSPAESPRPELFGPYLQFVFEHELSQQYDTHPPGPSSSFIVVDTHARRILTFDDLILPGQEKALENLQRAAFRAWLKTKRKLPDQGIRTHLANPSYAFRLNRNWHITEGGLVFRFATYELGPRSFGSPEIFVEKDRLRDIIQPDILEQIPAKESSTGN